MTFTDKFTDKFTCAQIIVQLFFIPALCSQLAPSWKQRRVARPFVEDLRCRYSVTLRRRGEESKILESL